MNRLVLASSSMSNATLSLVDRCLSGEGRAWRELHGRYHAQVVGFLRHMGAAPGDLEDASQEVFLQVFRYLGRFEQRADLRTWIYKICLSQAARIRRRRKIGAAVGWLLRQGRDGQAGGANDESWSEGEVRRRVQRALDRMKPIHRSVFVLYELEGLSGEEVAEVTRLPHATVRRRLHHARQAFEASIREEEGSEP